MKSKKNKLVRNRGNSKKKVKKKNNTKRKKSGIVEGGSMSRMATSPVYCNQEQLPPAFNRVKSFTANNLRPTIGYSERHSTLSRQASYIKYRSDKKTIIKLIPNYLDSVIKDCIQDNKVIYDVTCQLLELYKNRSNENIKRIQQKFENFFADAMNGMLGSYIYYSTIDNSKKTYFNFDILFRESGIQEENEIVLFAGGGEMMSGFAQYICKGNKNCNTLYDLALSDEYNKSWEFISSMLMLTSDKFVLMNDKWTPELNQMMIMWGFISDILLIKNFDFQKRRIDFIDFLQLSLSSNKCVESTVEGQGAVAEETVEQQGTPNGSHFTSAVGFTQSFQDTLHSEAGENDYNDLCQFIEGTHDEVEFKKSMESNNVVSEQFQKLKKNSHCDIEKVLSKLENEKKSKLLRLFEREEIIEISKNFTRSTTLIFIFEERLYKQEEGATNGNEDIKYIDTAILKNMLAKPGFCRVTLFEFWLAWECACIHNEYINPWVIATNNGLTIDDTYKDLFVESFPEDLRYVIELVEIDISNYANANKEAFAYKFEKVQISY